MALTFEWGDVEDWQGVNPDLRTTMVWTCLRVQIGTITKRNATDFYNRVAALRTIYGPEFTYLDGSEVSITLADVERCIGLRTNVGSASKVAFNANLTRRCMERGQRTTETQEKTANEILFEREAMAAATEAS